MKCFPKWKTPQNEKFREKKIRKMKISRIIESEKKSVDVVPKLLQSEIRVHI